MLDGIQTQTVDPGLPQVPEQPFSRFPGNCGIGHVNIHAHQIVIIAEIRIDLLRPVFAGEPVDLAFLLAGFIPVRAGKVRMVPGKVTVCPMPPGEGKA